MGHLGEKLNLSYDKMLVRDIRLLARANVLWDDDEQSEVSVEIKDKPVCKGLR